MLQNNRIEALKLFNKQKDTTGIQYLITKQVIREDNGLITPDKNFIKRLQTHPDFEYYLYALWNESFVFSDYVGSGFNAFNKNAIQQVNESNIKTNAIKTSFLYVKSTMSLSEGNWEDYEKINAQIPAVNQWEFCGLFENMNNSGHTIAYPPETNPSHEVQFNTQNYGMVHWYTPPAQPEPYFFFSNHDEFGNNVNYAQTFLNFEAATQANIKLGRAGAVKVWVNDVLLYEDDKDVATDMNAVTIPVQFLKGNNRVLIKLASELHNQYFSFLLEDVTGKPLSFQINLQNKAYQKGTPQKPNVNILEHEAVQYFKKIKLNQNNNFLIDYLLFLSYLRNSDYVPAKALIENWYNKYPNSSFLKNCLITVYTLQDDDTTVQELRKNIENNDPEYYISYLYKMQESNKLFKEDQVSFEKTVGKISNATDLTFMKTMAQFLLEARSNNLDKLKQSVDLLFDDPYFYSNLKPTFAEYYARLNDEEKTINRLEIINKNHFNYKAINSLSYYYKKKNEQEKSLAVYNKPLDKLSYNNDVLEDYINRLIDFKKYEEVLTYINKGLVNFPFSAKFQRLKGDALVQLDKKKEAIESYEKSLDRNPLNKSVRKKIENLTGAEDLIEKIRITDAKSFIENNRNTIKTNNYGINILLDESNVLLYPKGGGKYKTTYIYEVTSQKGIESLKEYDLGLSGDYTILKSEIVKPDNTIVPAEKSGSSFVFNNLSVGDVILLDFEGTFTSTGRFYKEYTDVQSYDSYHPFSKKIYRILSKEQQVNFTAENGNIPFKKYNKDGYTVYEWMVENSKEINDYEDFMPSFEEVAKTLHISTMGDWNMISNWYSDLVRSQMVVDDEVEKAIQQIFPEGFQNLTHDEKVKALYNYVTGDFTYSYVSFKQSGFVPQKPSKTIKTKLGDCKDFSTLFVTLAKEVGVVAQLVLILTSDYGRKALMLPSTEFNHCIVKTKYQGKPQFLELTDKYLPFRALPTSLHCATALDIPYETTSESNAIYTIYKTTNRAPSVFVNNAVIQVSDDDTTVQLETIANGHTASYYLTLFDEENNEVLKNQLIEDLTQRSLADVTVNSFLLNQKDNDKVNFSLDLKYNKRGSKIGSFYTFSLPYFATPYTQGIIAKETRNYPIDYNLYEGVDRYTEKFLVLLQPQYAFFEIPENKTLTFKDHECKVAYNLTEKNKLEIIIETIPGIQDIAVEEYEDFKTFVRSILEIREQILAYK